MKNLKIYKLEDDMMYDTINYKASQWYALLDYITNLQQKVENQRQELVSLNDRLKEVKKSNGFLKQENERLKENAIHNDKVVDKAKWNEMIYKSRIEKASEMIRFIAFNSERPLTVTELNKVYNILQGVGKDD